MYEDFKAIWASVWARVVEVKDWLASKSYAFNISALHLVYVALACMVALGAAYKLGKWDGSAHGLKQMAYGFVTPAADPPKEQIAAQLAQCKDDAAFWEEQSNLHLHSAESIALKVAAPLPTLAPSKCVAGKTVYVRVPARTTTVLQDLGVVK